MAGLYAVLRALARAVYRQIRSLGSITSNSFFLFAVLLLNRSGVFLQLVMALLLLFPLSADPLRLIPPERLGLWPFSGRQRAALRFLSIWLSPAVWVTAGLIVWAAQPILGLKFLALALACQALSLGFSALLDRAPRLNPFHWIPAFPGVAGGLVRKNLRELLSMLDPYCALLLVAATVAYRAWHGLEPDALLMMTLLVVLAMSTPAQSLFGLDSSAGFTRYRLLPLRGWQILAAKDAAFLTVLVVLVAPLRLLPGLAAGLVVLSLGHHSSVRKPAPQARWRFSGGGSIGEAIVQVVAMFGAGTVTARTSALAVLGCAPLYLVSLWFYGRDLERFRPEAIPS